MPNTVRLHRVLATKPEKVYRAFIEADAMAKWLPPTALLHRPSPRCEGRRAFRMSFRNFTTGASHSFGGKYLELVPGERLRLHEQIRGCQFAGGNAGDVALKPVSVGTEVNIVQEGIPDAIPAEACYLGWQESLRNLARLPSPKSINSEKRGQKIGSLIAAATQS